MDNFKVYYLDLNVDGSIDENTAFKVNMSLVRTIKDNADGYTTLIFDHNHQVDVVTPAPNEPSIRSL